MQGTTNNQLQEGNTKGDKCRVRNGTGNACPIACQPTDNNAVQCKIPLSNDIPCHLEDGMCNFEKKIPKSRFHKYLDKVTLNYLLKSYTLSKVKVKGFTKQCKTSCYESQSYGSYNNLLAAKHACHEDIGCAMVLDINCDYEGIFKLCPKGSSLESTLGSCVHVQDNQTNGNMCNCFHKDLGFIRSSSDFEVYK